MRGECPRPAGLHSAIGRKEGCRGECRRHAGSESLSKGANSLRVRLHPGRNAITGQPVRQIDCISIFIVSRSLGKLRAGKLDPRGHAHSERPFLLSTKFARRSFRSSCVPFELCDRRTALPRCPRLVAILHLVDVGNEHRRNLRGRAARVRQHRTGRAGRAGRAAKGMKVEPVQPFTVLQSKHAAEQQRFAGRPSCVSHEGHQLWIRGPRTMAIRRESQRPCPSCSYVGCEEPPQPCPDKVKLSCRRFAIRRASRDAVHVGARKACGETARLDAIRKRPTDPRSGLRGGFLSHKVKMGIGLSSLNGKNGIELKRYFSSHKSHIRNAIPFVRSKVTDLTAGLERNPKTDEPRIPLT